MNSLATEAMQSWFIVKVAVALSPILIFGVADIIGWFLRRTLWRRPEGDPGVGGHARNGFGSSAIVIRPTADPD